MSGPSESFEGDLLRVPLGDTDSLSDILEVLARLRFARGDQPFGRAFNLHRLPVDADITPLGGWIGREHVENGCSTTLVVGDGWTLLLRLYSRRSGWLEVTATSPELAVAVGEAIVKQDDPPAPVDDVVTMGFWHLTLNCERPDRLQRRVDAPQWDEIRRNYAAGVGASLERLMALDQPKAGGRLLLLHGPPGTGKSTVIRSLARRWRDWCRFEFVLDPERLFKDSGYLVRVLLHETDQASLPEDEGDEPRQWRLLILEDCDELIRSDAKATTGQSLSRLLNMTDGLVGEGLQVLVCITTNEELSRLHPAIVRPGRCLANVHFTPLSPAEAATWLGRPSSAARHGATLAELFQEQGASNVISAAPATERPGLYL